MTQQFSRKIRGFVVDLHTGKPIPNAVLLFEAKIIDDKSEFTFPLGVLVTDSAGYASFDLSRYAEDKLPQIIQITPVGDEECKSSVSASLVNQSELKIHFVLKVNSNCVKCKKNIGLPSVQNPDDIDREVSPHSFTVKNELMLGEGNCQVPIPALFEQRDFRFRRIVLKANQNLEDNLQSLDQKLLTVSELNPAMELGQQENDLPLRVAEVLEFRQRWYPLGHSLGQIAYSLPLAPCESVNLAMIDWSRQDAIQRDDSIQSRELLLHDQRRDRTIEETIEAALSESQDGFSSLMGGGFGGNIGASAPIPIEGIPINLSASLSGMTTGAKAIAHSSGERDITADSLQKLNDNIQQSTSVIRSLKSTVIVQATQQEENLVQTRTVTNHNHCHALTIQYYEVLQAFRVVTEFERRRRVLLIPYKIISFNWNIALRFETLLKAVLLEPSLVGCFEAIKRLHLCPQIYPDSEETSSTTGKDETGSNEPKKSAPKIQKYELTLSTGKAKEISFGVDPFKVTRKYGDCWGPVYVRLKLKDDTEKLLFHKPNISDPGGVMFQYEQDYTVLLPFPNECVGLNPFDIKEVSIRWMESNADDAWGLRGVKIRYQLEGEDQLNYMLIDASNPIYLKWFDDPPREGLFWTQPVSAPPVISPKEAPVILEDPSTPTGTGQPPVRLSQKADECCEQRLLTHLNGNIGYYNRAIWLLQDSVERRVLLEGLLAESGLADLVDETPVAVSGRYVAFPFDDPRLENVLLQSSIREALSRLGLGDDILNDIWNRAIESRPQEPPKPEPLVSYVSLPTRGLFAEAQLGHCNSCEVRDVTRFWKWGESPCEKAPTIEGISPGPKGQAPTIPEPAALPNPVVQVMQAPAAPDPVGLAAALNLLGQPNIFRDMSGLSEVSQLLGKLASVSGGGVKSAPSEQDPGKQIDKLNAIKYGLDEGLIDERQAADAATGVLGGTPIASSDSGFVPEGGTPILNITTNIVSFTSQDSLLSDGTVGPALLKFTAQILRPDGSPVEAPLHWRVEGNGVWSGGGGVGASVVGGSFSFSPTGAPTSNYGLGRGAREDLMSYIITASTIVDGVTIRDALIIQQNEVDQLRQEYIDYGLTVPDRGSFGAVPNNDTNFLAGNINGTVRRTNRGATRDEYGFILNGANMRTIGQQIGAEYSNLVAAATGQPGPFHVRVSSGYRNPLRNEEVGGCFSRGVPVPVCQGPSRHMTGEALDLVPGEVVRGASMADLMDILNTAVSNVGLNPLPESGTVRVGNPRLADHIHVQF